jgi:hypothetical protein
MQIRVPCCNCSQSIGSIAFQIYLRVDSAESCNTLPVTAETEGEGRNTEKGGKDITIRME